MYRENNFYDFGAHQVLIARVAKQYIESPYGENVITTIEAGTCNIPQAVKTIGQSYDSAGLIGLDGIFAPYYISPQGNKDDLLPSWNEPLDEDILSAKHLNPFNPNLVFHSGAFQAELFHLYGHNISFVNTFQSVGYGSIGDLNTYKDLAARGTSSYEEVRGVGLRSPIIVSGWGYDIEENPVPYVEGDDGSKFLHPEALRNPRLWKSGPLDIKWDEKRGVWTFRSGDLLHGIVVSDMGCGYYEIELAKWVGEFSDDCDPCKNEGSGFECSVVIPSPPLQVEGIGESVIGYAEFASTIPLKIGSSCRMWNFPSKYKSNESGSEPAIGNGELIYHILTGYRETIVKYEEDRSQCEDECDEGVVMKTPIIYEAKVCDPVPCQTCEEDEYSGGGGDGGCSGLGLPKEKSDVHGIVRESLGCGYYTIEIAEWNGTTPTEGNDCNGEPLSPRTTNNICDSVNVDGTIDLAPPKSQLNGTGVFVLAYDPGSTNIPLRIGSDVSMTNTCDVNALNGQPLPDNYDPCDPSTWPDPPDDGGSGGSGGSGSGSGSGSGNPSVEPVFQINRGERELTVQYVDRYLCCNGVDTLVGRTPIIIEALVCEEILFHSGSCPQ